MNAGRFRHLRTPQIDRERLGNRLREVTGYVQSLNARERLQPAFDYVGELQTRRQRSHRRRNAAIIAVVVLVVLLTAAVTALAVRRLYTPAPQTESEPTILATDQPTDASEIGETNGANGSGGVSEPEVQHAVTG
jgi:hypothetical protein